MTFRDIIFLLPWIFLTGLLALHIHAPKLQRTAGQKPGPFFNIYELLTLFLGLSIICMSIFRDQLPPLFYMAVSVWSIFWLFVSFFASFAVSSYWKIFPASYLLIFFCLALLAGLLGRTEPLQTYDSDFVASLTITGAAISWLAIAALTISRSKSRPRLIATSKLKLKAGQN